MSLRCVGICILVAAVILGYGYYWLYGPLSTPELDVNQYWGPSARKNRADSPAIRPFKIEYSEDIIGNLRKRLDDAKYVQLVEPLEGVGFRYGFHKRKIEEVIKYWSDNYLPRWQQRQQYLNSFPHYKTEVQGYAL